MAGRDWASRVRRRILQWRPWLSMRVDGRSDIGICTGLVAFQIDKGHCEKLSLTLSRWWLLFTFREPFITARASYSRSSTGALMMRSGTRCSYPVRRGSKGRRDVPDLFDRYKTH